MNIAAHTHALSAPMPICDSRQIVQRCFVGQTTDPISGAVSRGGADAQRLAAGVDITVRKAEVMMGHEVRLAAGDPLRAELLDAVV